MSATTTIARLAPMTGRSSDAELARLVAFHQQGLWRYLRALGADAALAEDLLQDSFLVAFDKLDPRAEPGAAAAFLRRTARHLFLRHRRDHGRREELLAEALERNWQAEGAADDGERWLDALRACVEGLEGRTREAVQRFYGDGASRADVARGLGMKETGVKTLLQRVRETLRECVERRLRAGGEL